MSPEIGRAVIELHTERLRLVCLDLEAFRHFLHAHERMERLLGVEVTAEALDPGLREELLPRLRAAEADPDRIVWHSNWQIVATALNRIVGGFCFKGPPNARGEVEIGYGLDLGFRGRGYMTEAIGAVLPWALAQVGVSAVVAETEPENLASHGVLVRCGMRLDRKSPTAWWWRRDRCWR